MTELAIFGICIAIILIFLLLIVLFFPHLLLLVLIFPVLISETITGERGTFSPNGSSKKSPLFNLLTVLFVIIQILLLAGVLFGINWLAGGVIPVEIQIDSQTETSRITVSPLEIDRMLLINTILWITSISFALLLLVNLFRFRQMVKQMSKFTILLGYGLPILTYPLVYFFLFSTRKYLLNYPQGEHYLNFFTKIAALLYGLYLLNTLFRDIRQHIAVIKNRAIIENNEHSSTTFQYWSVAVLSLLYKALFIYFVIGLYKVLQVFK